jgi:hypothetical protein
MASISNLRLSIGPVAGSTRKLVTVTYNVCFTPSELLDGSVFDEKVTLRGDDPIWDDHLITLSSTSIKAVPTPVPAPASCMERKVVRKVSRKTLDEDGDTIIFGVPVFLDRDEVYARVTLTPFNPRSSSADSNVIEKQFGPI